jgi:hypothetical protein
MTIKITNPSDSSEDLVIQGFTIGNAAWMDKVSLNDQDITSEYTAITAWKQVTLAPGQSTELRISVKDVTAGNSAVSLTAITVQVSWEAAAIYNITSTYTNVAKWADLKITYKK